MKVKRQILVALSLILFSCNLFSQNTFPSSGNVGIGISTPSTRLQVTSATPGTSGVRLTNMTSTTTTATGNNKALSVDASGNIILTPVINTPATDVSIYNYDGDLSAIRTVNMNGKNLIFNPLTTNSQFILDGTSGNVGIGTSTPNAQLHLKSSLDNIMTFQTSDNSWLYTNWLNSSGTRKAWMGLDNTLASFYINVENGANKILFNGGNVGIGLYDPVSKFQVEGDINSSGVSLPRKLGFNTNDITTNGIANYGLTCNAFPIGVTTDQGPGMSVSGYYGLSFYTVGSERIRINQSGFVGIGKINPSSMLDVNGDITALAIKGPSDIRFKKNLKPLESSLDKIIKLNGYSYEWRKEEFPDKNFKKGTDIGLIAQEVEKVFPEVVYTDNDEMKSKSIDYSKLVPALVESIKELQKEVEALKAELNQKK